MEPKAPAPAPQPGAPQQPELPPLTRGQKIKYSLIAALVLIGIIAFVVFLVVSGNQSNENTERLNDLKQTGLKVTGTANGNAYEFTDRNRRGSDTKYKAIYSYTAPNPDRDGRMDEGTAIGEKVYDTKEEVEALKGKTADVYYDEDDAGKGTFVDDAGE